MSFYRNLEEQASRLPNGPDKDTLLRKIGQLDTTTRLNDWLASPRLKRLTDHPHDGGFNLKPDDPRVIEQQRLLDKATDDLKRLNELYETRTAAWHGASHVLSSVETWLKNGGRSVRCDAGGSRNRCTETGQGRERFARCH